MIVLHEHVAYSEIGQFLLIKTLEEKTAVVREHFGLEYEDVRDFRLDDIHRSKHLFFQQLQQVLSISVFLHGCCKCLQLAGTDVTTPKSNLFGTCDLQPLSLLDRLNEQPSFKQGFVCSRVQPGKAAPHDLRIQHPTIEICSIQVRDFQFAT